MQTEARRDRAAALYPRRWPCASPGAHSAAQRPAGPGSAAKGGMAHLVTTVQPKLRGHARRVDLEHVLDVRPPGNPRASTESRSRGDAAHRGRFSVAKKSCRGNQRVLHPEGRPPGAVHRNEKHALPWRASRATFDQDPEHVRGACRPRRHGTRTAPKVAAQNSTRTSLQRRGATPAAGRHRNADGHQHTPQTRIALSLKT